MNLIVAVDDNYGIGCANGLIYSIKKDMQHFKELTLNKVVVMGSKTFYSLPGKKALAGRVNIVLTSREDFNEPNTIAAHSLTELNNLIKNFDGNDIFVIGGASIYNQLMPYCKFAYITKIEGSKTADTYMNNLDRLDNWKIQEASEPQQENGQTFTFCLYENTNVKSLDEGINLSR